MPFLMDKTFLDIAKQHEICLWLLFKTTYEKKDVEEMVSILDDIKHVQNYIKSWIKKN